MQNCFLKSWNMVISVREKLRLGAAAHRARLNQGKAMSGVRSPLRRTTDHGLLGCRRTHLDDDFPLSLIVVVEADAAEVQLEPVAATRMAPV
jgi:hypothetical protein